jgi:hypothetical protein
MAIVAYPLWLVLAGALGQETGCLGERELAGLADHVAGLELVPVGESIADPVRERKALAGQSTDAAGAGLGAFAERLTGGVPEKMAGVRLHITSVSWYAHHPRLAPYYYDAGGVFAPYNSPRGVVVGPVSPRMRRTVSNAWPPV